MSFLNKYSLGTQLTLIFWLVISVIILTIASYDYNRRVNEIKQAKLDNIQAISKGVSTAIVKDVYTNNFVSLEQKLLGLNEIPEIDKIKVYDQSKTVIAEIIRDNKGVLTPTYQYGIDKNVVNKELAGYTPDECIIVRNPIAFSDKNLAWIQIVSNKVLMENIKKGIIVELAYLCGSILIITFFITFVFLRTRLHSLKNLTEFSKKLPHGQGESVYLNNAPAEFQSLSQSLNWASKEIETQKNIILQENKKLDEKVKKRTRELESAKKIAENASMAKTDFLSRMSHELRTPMNAILGFSQILTLKSSSLNKEQHMHATEILNAGNHLLTLINDILDLATIESGKLTVSIEDVQLNDVLNQCINLIKYQAHTRDIEIVDNISHQNHRLHTDPQLLKQCLLNLLSNAVKYNNEHGSIRIDSKIINGQNIRISVSDTGLGLSKDDLKKLFSSFERLHANYKIEGTGIGLVITKHFIEALGGTIKVESHPGEGSTFSIELPLNYTL